MDKGKGMTIKPSKSIGSWKQASIHHVTVEDMVALLGPPNVEDDAYKVKHSWAFEVDGVPCAVWDCKGSQEVREWSAWGPKAALRKVFGHKLVGYIND